jgi:uncharacterized protein
MEDDNQNTNQGSSRRGFAGMDPSKQKEISSKGGKAAHEKGTAHEFTADEAREAGRKGGQRVSQDRAHMAAIGRAGGRSRGRDRTQQSQASQPGAPQQRPASSGGGVSTATAPPPDRISGQTH